MSGFKTYTKKVVIKRTDRKCTVYGQGQSSLFVRELMCNEFITPFRYEELTGRKYPVKAPVWYAEADLVWDLRPYGEALQDYTRRDMDSLYTYMVCAFGDRLPEDGSLPDCCEKQWFGGEEQV
jgi:hypothetical protein